MHLLKKYKVVTVKSFNNILSRINDAFFAFDKEDRVVFANKAAMEFINNTKTQKYLGKYIWDLFPKAVGTTFYNKFTQAKNKDNTTRFEIYYNPSRKWFFVSLYPSDTGISAYFTDITKAKKVEKEKSDFLSIVAHELKTPLTSIKAYTQILKKRYKGDDSGQILDSLDNQINRLIELISEILDIKRIEMNRYQLTKSQVLVSVLVKEVLKDIKPLINEYDISVIGKSTTEIYVDKFRIVQVLTNLIMNAAKYSKIGSKIKIMIKENKENTTVCIKDQGIGISKKQKKIIFNKFFQIKDYMKENFSLGLGLYITKKIVTMHKGTIWVESDLGKGSNFCFTLPNLLEKK